jgi:hypothetical protein
MPDKPLTPADIVIDMMRLGATITTTPQGNIEYTLTKADDYARLRYLPKAGYRLETRIAGTIRDAGEDDPNLLAQLWRLWRGKGE